MEAGDSPHSFTAVLQVPDAYTHLVSQSVIYRLGKIALDYLLVHHQGFCVIQDAAHLIVQFVNGHRADLAAKNKWLYPLDDLLCLVAGKNGPGDLGRHNGLLEMPTIEMPLPWVEQEQSVFRYAESFDGNAHARVVIKQINVLEPLRICGRVRLNKLSAESDYFIDRGSLEGVL